MADAFDSPMTNAAALRQVRGCEALPATVPGVRLAKENATYVKLEIMWI